MAKEQGKNGSDHPISEMIRTQPTLIKVFGYGLLVLLTILILSFAYALINGNVSVNGGPIRIAPTDTQPVKGPEIAPNEVQGEKSNPAPSPSNSKEEIEDYLHNYELAISYINSKDIHHHDKAFENLRDAAEVAIENNQTKELLKQINKERETRLWKLSHGHPELWNPIIEALIENNKKRLHGYDALLKEGTKKGHSH